jgi:uncharacterized membrane protein YeaQ/YmgE (transglycosylase-associated protein family)
MDIITWLLIGLVAGIISSFFVRPGKKSNLIVSIILGMVGAFVGGFIMQKLGYNGVSGFNLYSILVATGGAIVVVIIGKILF